MPHRADTPERDQTEPTQFTDPPKMGREDGEFADPQNVKRGKPEFPISRVPRSVDPQFAGAELRDLDEVVGAIVQKVEKPSRYIQLPTPTKVMALSIRLPGQSLWIAAISGRSNTIGITSRSLLHGGEPRPADSETMRFRKRLEGARVLAVFRQPPRIVFRRGEESLVLFATRHDVSLVDLPQESDPLTYLPTAGIVEGDLTCESLRADEVLVGLSTWLERSSRDRLVRSIEKYVGKLRRRIAAVAGDLAKIAEADAWTARGMLLSSVAHQVKRGATAVQVTDWSTGELVSITLDPAQTAREQAEAIFRRSKRLKGGAAIAQKRKEQTEREVDRLILLQQQVLVDGAQPALVKRAESFGVRMGAVPNRGSSSEQKQQEERLAYRTYKSGEFVIHVGRSAKDNDVLTTKIAKPHDLFLHAKGVTGSHVIIPLPRSAGGAAPSEVLVDAAHLAAHFSDARGEKTIEIQYAERRHIRKPRGIAAGAVVVEREKVIVLRFEPDRLARLLASQTV